MMTNLNEIMMIEVLTKIANWELPETGKFWDEEKTRPMSYGSCYGSKGEKEYIQKLAKDILFKIGVE